MKHLIVGGCSFLGSNIPSKIFEQELDIEMTYKQRPARNSDQMVFGVNITKAKNLICWEPQVGKAVGIRKIIQCVLLS